MAALDSKLDPRDATFVKNRDAMAALVEDLRAVVARIEQGGSIIGARGLQEIRSPEAAPSGAPGL